MAHTHAAHKPTATTLSPRTIMRALVHIMARIALSILVAITAVALLVFIQAQHDDAQPVDAIVVLSVGTPPEAHITHALHLYQWGYASRIILVGNNVQHANTTITHYTQQEYIVTVISPIASRYDGLYSVAQHAQLQGYTRIVMIDEPAALLNDLKMARDMGFDAVASPPPNTTPSLGALWHASLTYWHYILFQQRHPPLLP